MKRSGIRGLRPNRIFASRRAAANPFRAVVRVDAIALMIGANGRLSNPPAPESPANLYFSCESAPQEPSLVNEIPARETTHGKRRIGVVTTSRADYSHLYWPLRELAAHPEVDLGIIALGSHLSPEFGCTASEIEKDGFPIEARIECLLSSDSDVGMAKTIGVATLGLADCLGQMRPDLLMLIADRYEMLAPASVATALRIPIVHIEGGEISEGVIDDAIRNALTKLSHIHFTSTELARARVVAMGEEAWRVHRAGAPSLDHLRRSPPMSREQVEARLDIHFTRPTAVIAYHPTTIARDPTREADALFAALESIPAQLLFCYPNSDAGSRALIERTNSFIRRLGSGRVFVNLDPVLYWSLLRCVDLLLGNSSSGIMEAASFAL